MPDSHMNAYVRFKLALTEEEPTIKPYAESLWAQLPDTQSTPLETSLVMLEMLHDRFVRVLRSMTHEQWKRTLRHPGDGRGHARTDSALSTHGTAAHHGWRTSLRLEKA